MNESKILTGRAIYITPACNHHHTGGQDNLAGNAAASSDATPIDYPAEAAIDGDTTNGAGWGVLALDTVNQDAVNIAPKP